MGYGVDYVTTWSAGLSRYEKLCGVNIYRVPVVGRRTCASAGMLSLLSFPVCAYHKAEQLCRKNRYEFINTHFAVPSGPLGIWMSKKYGIPNILSLHGGDLYDPTKKFSPHRSCFFRNCVSWVLNRSDFVVAQSENTKSNAGRFYRYDNSQVKIIPLPYQKVDFKSQNRNKMGMNEKDKYLISVGRLVRRKGYGFLLDTVAGLKEYKLIIIGDGPEREHLYKKIRDLHMEDRVIFAGQVSEKVKFQYLQNADLYVLSSVHEGFGIVLQEAMQVGLPIVSTDFGGQTDLIEQGVNGFLVPYGDKRAMARAIRQILTDPALMHRIKRNNLAKIQSYAPEKIAGEYLNMVERR